MIQNNMTTHSELKSSAQWYKEITDGIIVMADGWPGAIREEGDTKSEALFEYSWNEPITKEEFLRRRSKSVVLFQP